MPFLGNLFARLLGLRRKSAAPLACLDTPPTDYRAVSIVPTQASCAEARRLRKKRYLSSEAPRLPLPQCAQPLSCKCRYRKYPDRRVDERRDIAGSGRFFMGQDRRKSNGRRATDDRAARIDITWSHRE